MAVITTLSLALPVAFVAALNFYRWPDLVIRRVVVNTRLPFSKTLPDNDEMRPAPTGRAVTPSLVISKCWGPREAISARVRTAVHHGFVL
jgi:hypothetical protein